MAKTATAFAIDAAGNYYGGADGAIGSVGVGDVVQDANGAKGTVKAIWQKTDDFVYYILARMLPNNPLTCGAGWCEPNSLQELECRADQCTIISHSDGSGLVASGKGAQANLGNSAPTQRKFFRG